MEKYSVFYLTYFFTGVLHFSSIAEVLRNLKDRGISAQEWECNDEGHEETYLPNISLSTMAIGPGNGHTFVYQADHYEFRNYLHIQRNF
jgi:hypothetical protein